MLVQLICGDVCVTLTGVLVVRVVIFGGGIRGRGIATSLQVVIPVEWPLATPAVVFVDVCKGILLPLLNCKAIII